MVVAAAAADGVVPIAYPDLIIAGAERDVELLHAGEVDPRCDAVVCVTSERKPSRIPAGEGASERRIAKIVAALTVTDVVAVCRPVHDKRVCACPTRCDIPSKTCYEDVVAAGPGQRAALIVRGERV